MLNYRHRHNIYDIARIFMNLDENCEVTCYVNNKLRNFTLWWTCRKIDVQIFRWWIYLQTNSTLQFLMFLLIFQEDRSVMSHGCLTGKLISLIGLSSLEENINQLFSWFHPCRLMCERLMLSDLWVRLNNSNVFEQLRVWFYTSLYNL